MPLPHREVERRAVDATADLGMHVDACVEYRRGFFNVAVLNGIDECLFHLLAGRWWVKGDGRVLGGVQRYLERDDTIWIVFILVGGYPVHHSEIRIRARVARVGTRAVCWGHTLASAESREVMLARFVRALCQ